jgi:hypothetical protein
MGNGACSVRRMRIMMKTATAILMMKDTMTSIMMMNIMKVVTGMTLAAV